MPEKKRILLVAPLPPFPPTNGGVLRIFSLVNFLKERFSFSLLCFAASEGPEKYTQGIALVALEKLFDEIHTVPYESIISARDYACPGLPRLALDWYSPAMAAKVQELSAEGGYDIMHFEFLQMAFYSWYASGVKTFYTEHDLSHVSLFNSYFREWTGASRLRQLPQWLKVVRYHKKVCSGFDHIITLTEKDTAGLARIVPGAKVTLVKTGSDPERFHFRLRNADENGDAIVYVGHYRHYPNEEAALRLATKIFPLVKRGWPGAKLQLVGSDPTGKIKALASPDIAVTGTVPEIHPYLSSGAVFAAPVRLGFGIKGKVIEAFFSGIPVVASRTVADGIPEARHGQHMLVAGSDADFAAALVRLKQDPELKLRLSANAHDMARRCYSWPELASKLGDAYDRELAG
ncbi:MAG: glycosyltransferase [Elusimicrobia bacterium]|nr:glycosyltransferase [Elusimicrobiota bacterium]